MMLFSRGFKQYLLISLISCLAACGPNKKELMKISQLTTDMTTFCMGRHLVDVPKSFAPMAIPWSSNTFMPVGIDPQEAAQMSAEVLDTASSPQKFKTQVEMVLAENRLERQSSTTFPLLDHTEKLSENEVLLRLWNPNLDKESGSRTTEIHKLSSGVYFYTQAKSYQNDFPEKEKSLKEFTRNITAYDATKPAQKGFCLGPPLISGAYESENVMGLTFRSPQFPDMVMTFDLSTHSGDSETTLLQRANDPKNLLSIFDINYSTLRKSTSQIAGMKAEELLVKFTGKDREGNAHLEHKLMMETYRPKPSVSQPTIEARLTTGQQGLDGTLHTSSLTDTEVTALWDAVLKSIRLRPGAV